MPIPAPQPPGRGPQDQLEAERRPAPRYPSGLHTVCRTLTGRDGHSWPAQVLDISRGGIALLLKRRFEPGAVLVMDLEAPDQAVRRSVFARVLHVREHGGGLWRLGCAFAAELNEDELPGPDRRAWVRFGCDVATTCRDAGDPDGRPAPARIVNVAPGGVGLLLPSPCEQGALLWLDLPGAPGQPGRRLLVRVAQPPRPAGGRWEVGCEFADQLTDDDLQGLMG
jgi:hypothetical protein